MESLSEDFKPGRLHDEYREADGARIEVRRFCAKEDAEVALEDIGHAYELDSGKTVVLTDAELDAVAPKKTRTIEIASFVDAREIDPILYDHPYWLLPTGDSAGTKRAYRLLVEATPRRSRAAGATRSGSAIRRPGPRPRRYGVPDCGDSSVVLRTRWSASRWMRQTWRSVEPRP
ncbi:MAG TPA: Ku protein [Baekduia sp.]|uniref:Ku protein n=1 Tax=Baekduia sp. TaxID=2600305 RepID=UPI002D79F446|nr:Ku protein [Baekduia sp.]HET6509585.1 Ku protein [Baekduia sp.]